MATLSLPRGAIAWVNHPKDLALPGEQFDRVVRLCGCCCHRGSWRNGRRYGLKIRCSQEREGSSPSDPILRKCSERFLALQKTGIPVVLPDLERDLAEILGWQRPLGLSAQLQWAVQAGAAMA